MNEDVLKPFPCKEIDCGMSFFTEDHLSVHYQAKHSKLNLEIPKGSNVIFADQTPTPTRLLNNCEELRVFDDLQNINPFEEGFRRAVEDNSHGISHFLTTPSNQDTLHTPQILPQFENRPVKREFKEEIPTQDEPENLTIPTTIEESTNIPNLTQQSPSDFVDLKSHLKSTQPPIPLLPKIIYAAPIITTQATMKLSGNDVNRANESVKDRLKNILLSNSGLQSEAKRRKMDTIPSILIGAVPLVATSTNLIITSDNKKTKKASNDSGRPSETIEKSSDIDVDTQKRTKPSASILKVERNRAAARRYRTKMKIQSQALQEKQDKSQRELGSLKKELTDLKKELTQLKTLLLLHKDCSVSKAMTSNSQSKL